MAVDFETLRSVVRERFTDQSMVLGQDLGVPIAERLEQCCRTLDVGEKEGDGAFGEV